ncbi:uncharacterized protein STEHIDRAFT_52732 [Stereum hirsutum FP-91666 SS1]|uniref:uncharacterized protein n=1 Tax=Stereum hirsutum (strain FP-91666) TaxID=721885 RepID=UPI0004409F70|nr:uncharacterized protein STEHIDRAFT_52732 [Stereum hirsutum FP-91666 SS1]EIM89412.1 hypothetical protein STEHIDRAFT_52732 [Stereum hirsutum FP-91666 SS1]
MSAVDTSLGAVELGGMIMMLLYGIMVAQAYTYYKSSYSDSLFPINLRCTHSPSRCRFTETFHTAIVVAFIYITSVTDYGQPWTLNAAHWTGQWSVSIASLNIAIIQGFFAWRVRCLSGRWTIPILSWTGSSVRVGSSIAVGVLTQRTSLLSVFLDKYRWLNTLCLGIGAAVDLLNTAALCYYLRKGRSGSFNSSQALIDTLILWTIGTFNLLKCSVILELTLREYYRDWDGHRVSSSCSTIICGLI